MATHLTLHERVSRSSLNVQNILNVGDVVDVIRDATSKVTDERTFAEEASVVMAGLGLSPAYGKVLGWLLVCGVPASWLPMPS